MSTGNSQPREIGVINARGITAYFSFDQTKTYSTYRREGSGVVRDSSIDELFQKRRNARDDRFFIAVLEGSLGFLQQYQRTLKMPHLIVYISTPAVLQELGVVVIDENWNAQQQKIDLNHYLPT
jgi:hypothetical protein